MLQSSSSCEQNPASVVTSTQDGVGGRRLLDVYGAVYAPKDPYALFGNMQEVIQALQILEEYRVRKISLVTATTSVYRPMM